jgi:hypothetical protein
MARAPNANPAPPIPPDTRLLGAGGYGAVVRPAFLNTAHGPHNRPGNVTKIFFDADEYDELMEGLPAIQELFDHNENHRATPYAARRTFGNLPDPLLREIEQRTQKTFRKADPLRMLRMPYLGVDISKIREVYEEGTGLKAYEKIRNRPVLLIVDQILKLLRQVDSIVTKGYVIGDIRDGNVMIEPSTGVLTLIDFDWMKKKNDFSYQYPFGFYNNPPECLLVSRGGFIRSLPSEAKKGPYVELFHRCFSYIREYFKDTAALKAALEAANVANLDYFTKHNIKSLRDGNTLLMFDGFGLACTLLTLFHTVYTTVSANRTTSLAALQHSLSSRITNNGVPYTAGELEACTRAILRMSKEVLLPLAEFEYEARSSVKDAISIAQSIRDELDAVMNPDLLSAGPAAVAAPVAAPVVAVGGAGAGGAAPAINHPLTAEEAYKAPLKENENEETKARKKEIANNLGSLFRSRKHTKHRKHRNHRKHKNHSRKHRKHSRN